MGRTGEHNPVPIRLAERRIFSSSFKPLYNEGMGLVEEAADYLDGDGRQQAKGLPSRAAAIYAAESMRLTTRLMQVASWLLLQRAANAGELSREQVLAEKGKVRLDTPSVAEDTAEWNELPGEFRELVRRSVALQNLVRVMDEEIYGGRAPRGARSQISNPVSDQINLLQTAFAGR